MVLILGRPPLTDEFLGEVPSLTVHYGDTSCATVRLKDAAGKKKDPKQT